MMILVFDEPLVSNGSGRSGGGGGGRRGGGGGYKVRSLPLIQAARVRGGFVDIVGVGPDVLHVDLEGGIDDSRALARGIYCAVVKGGSDISVLRGGSTSGDREDGRDDERKSVHVRFFAIL